MHLFLKISIIYLFFISLQLLVLANNDDDDKMAEKQISNIQKLRTKLLSGYDATVRPVIHHSNRTAVFFNIVPLYIVSLIEDKSLFQMDAWLFLNWNDYRLKWNASDYDGLEDIRFQSHSIWQPDILVYNGHSGSVDPSMNTHVFVHSSGSIVFVPPSILDTHCPITWKEGDYPEDKVTCKIKFGSWSHDGWQIDLQTTGPSMFLDEFHNQHPMWELLIDEANISRTVKYYACCEEPYVTIDASFPMKRRTPQELQVIWAPCVLIMAMTLTIFWIHPSSSKKLFLGGFLFVSLCLLIVYVAYYTKSRTSVKRSVTFLESTLYGLISVIIIEVFIVNLCQITGPYRPPYMLIQILSSPTARYFLIWPTWNAKIGSDKVQLNEEDDQSLHLPPTPKEEWTLVAVALDRLFFFIFIIVFAAIHQI